MASGKTTKWMGVVFLLGLMDADMRANTSMTRKKAGAFFTGTMVESTTDSGLMVSRMAWANTLLHPARRKKDSGRKANALLGFERVA